MNQAHTEDVLWPRYAEPPISPTSRRSRLLNADSRSPPMPCCAGPPRCGRTTALQSLPDGDRWRGADVLNWTAADRRAPDGKPAAAGVIVTARSLLPGEAQLRGTGHCHLGCPARRRRGAHQRRPVARSTSANSYAAHATHPHHGRPRTRPRDLGHRSTTGHRAVVAPCSCWHQPGNGEQARAPRDGRAHHRTAARLAMDFDGTEFTGIPPAGTDLAAVFHTGGTTGAPAGRPHPTPMRSPTPG